MAAFFQAIGLGDGLGLGTPNFFVEPADRSSMRGVRGAMFRNLLIALAALPLTLASASALACPRGDGNIDRVITRPIDRESNRVRAAELDRQARVLDQQAVSHTARAESARAAAQRLQEVVPVNFGEARDIILDRIDSLLERAAVETGEARSLRVRASQLRAEASRLRQFQERDNGTWRRRAPSSAPVVTGVDI